MSKLFTEYVTATAFKLCLTKNQIEIINAITSRTVSIAEGHSWFAGNTLYSLERKGIISLNPKGEYQLTDAGEAVYEVLAVAGL